MRLLKRGPVASSFLRLVHSTPCPPVPTQDAPVAAFEPADPANVRDCWSVAFGNSFNDEERCVLAGYDNVDVKMFDLRMNKAREGFRV